MDPKSMQLQVKAFMQDKAAVFMEELWDLMISAQESADGIAAKIKQERQAVADEQKAKEAKLQEMQQQMTEKITQQSRQIEEQLKAKAAGDGAGGCMLRACLQDASSIFAAALS